MFWKLEFMKKIILAATSPRRKELLEKTGIVFEVVPSLYEEDMSLKMSPAELAIFLSKGKAEDVANKNPDAIVIKLADRIANVENGIFYKEQNFIKMYADEYEEFRKILQIEGICDEMWTYLDDLFKSFK